MKEDLVNLNTQVVSWIEGGRIREALLGQGEYFISDHTYHSQHDIMLVMYVILNWAEQKRALSSVSESFAGFFQALADKGDWDNLRNIALAYDITSKDQKIALNLDVEAWHGLLPEELKWKKT